MFQIVPRPTFDMVDQLFSGFFDQLRHPRATTVLRPVLPVSVTEQTETYTLTAQLPEGVQKDNVSVEIHDGVLTISVKKDVAKHTEGEQVIFDERQAIDVTRRFDFGDNLAEDGHEAKVSDGNLVLLLKKSKVRQPNRLTIA